MDAFEEIVAGLLWEEGFWTTVGYKVNLPPGVKKALDKPSLPRPEIDVLAYRNRDNHLLWVECKSYLDSRGVIFEALSDHDSRRAQRYKVFTQPMYRQLVTAALIDQLVAEGRVHEGPSINYCLVTGKIATDRDRDQLHQYFDEQGWILYDEYWVKRGLENLAKKGYENDVAIIVAKLFSRVG